MKLNHLTHVECINVWKIMFSRARARIFLTTLAPSLADAYKSTLPPSGKILTESTLKSQHFCHSSKEGLHFVQFRGKF